VFAVVCCCLNGYSGKIEFGVTISYFITLSFVAIMLLYVWQKKKICHTHHCVLL